MKDMFGTERYLSAFQAEISFFLLSQGGVAPSGHPFPGLLQFKPFGLRRAKRLVMRLVRGSGFTSLSVWVKILAFLAVSNCRI
jgi:hypothetical protein